MNGWLSGTQSQLADREFLDRDFLAYAIRVQIMLRNYAQLPKKQHWQQTMQQKINKLRLTLMRYNKFISTKLLTRSDLIFGANCDSQRLRRQGSVFPAGIVSHSCARFWVSFVTAINTSDFLNFHERIWKNKDCIANSYRYFWRFRCSLNELLKDQVRFFHVWENCSNWFFRPL